VSERQYLYSYVSSCNRRLSSLFDTAASLRKFHLIVKIVHQVGM